MTKLKKHIVDILASGLYSGKAPKMSGTWGSLVAAVIIYLIWLSCPSQPSLCNMLILSVAITAVAWPITYYALNWDVYDTENKDPKQIVIDEWAGMSFAAIWCPMDIRALVLAFLLFRFFDILKPFPINKVEEMPGAAGVLFDDVLAGIMAAGIGYLIWPYLNS